MSEENRRTTVGRALQDFLTFHEMNKDSARTIGNYQMILARFVEWLSSVGIRYVDELSISHLRAWVGHLQKSPTRYSGQLGDSPVYQYALCTQVFCHWLEHKELLEKPITTRFRLPRVEKKFIPTFTPEDVEKLLAACEVGIATPVPPVYGDDAACGGPKSPRRAAADGAYDIDDDKPLCLAFSRSVETLARDVLPVAGETGGCE